MKVVAEAVVVVVKAAARRRRAIRRGAVVQLDEEQDAERRNERRRDAEDRMRGGWAARRQRARVELRNDNAFAVRPTHLYIMGRKGQAALGAGAHEEEFAELQRRFDALSSAKKLSETSPALLTKDMYRTEKKQQAVRRDDPQLHAQLKTLDEQIVQLRRRHDRLHDNNNKKRRELDLLADRPRTCNSAFKSEDAAGAAARAGGAARRRGPPYEESHRTKLTYEQVSSASRPSSVASEKALDDPRPEGGGLRAAPAHVARCARAPSRPRAARPPTLLLSHPDPARRRPVRRRQLVEGAERRSSPSSSPWSLARGASRVESKATPPCDVGTMALRLAASAAARRRVPAPALVDAPPMADGSARATREHRHGRPLDHGNHAHGGDHQGDGEAEGCSANFKGYADIDKAPEEKARGITINSTHVDTRRRAPLRALTARATPTTSRT